MAETSEDIDFHQEYQKLKTKLTQVEEIEIIRNKARLQEKEEAQEGLKEKKAEAEVLKASLHLGHRRVLELPSEIDKLKRSRQKFKEFHIGDIDSEEDNDLEEELILQALDAADVKKTSDNIVTTIDRPYSDMKARYDQFSRNIQIKPPPPRMKSAGTSIRKWLSRRKHFSTLTPEAPRCTTERCPRITRTVLIFDAE
jgi:predicted nuclease with TOPRIM domain